MLSPKVEDLAFTGSSYVNNLAHAVLFGFEALLLGLLWRPGEVGRPARVWWTAGLLALLYAGLLEWRQSFMPGRTASMIDMLTDAIGSLGRRRPGDLGFGLRSSCAAEPPASGRPRT